MDTPAGRDCEAAARTPPVAAGSFTTVIGATVLAVAKTVYVVDDDPAILRAVRRLLKAHALDAEVFESAEDFNRRADPRGALCLVLDIHMKGMSGIELSQQLAHDGISPPVIFISADDSEATRRATREAGCVAHLAKPFRMKSLIEAIGRASAVSRTQ
jgi:FixJ family two-component response regulator